MDTKICVILDSNNVIISYGVCLSDTHTPLENGTTIETDLDLDVVDIVDNYKLVDGTLVELTDDEKESLFPTPTPQPTEIERISALEEALLMIL